MPTDCSCVIILSLSEAQLLITEGKTVFLRHVLHTANLDIYSTVKCSPNKTAIYITGNGEGLSLYVNEFISWRHGYYASASSSGITSASSSGIMGLLLILIDLFFHFNEHYWQDVFVIAQVALTTRCSDH